MRAWYLVYSKPSQESVALENLLRQNYRVYLPMLRTPRHQRTARAKSVQPMFPRYLFVHLIDYVDDWGPIRSTRGVMRIIRFGSTPARVPDDFIETLRSREDEHGVHSVPDLRYQPGERVRISDGSMAGYEAVFAGRTGKERVMLLLNIAGTEAKLQLSIDQIEPTGARW